MFLHWREMVVIVQQPVAMLDAEGADDDIGRLADRDAQFSKSAIVPGRAMGKIGCTVASSLSAFQRLADQARALGWLLRNSAGVELSPRGLVHH